MTALLEHIQCVPLWPREIRAHVHQHDGPLPLISYRSIVMLEPVDVLRPIVARTPLGVLVCAGQASFRIRRQ